MKAAELFGTAIVMDIATTNNAPLTITPYAARVAVFACRALGELMQMPCDTLDQYMARASRLAEIMEDGGAK